MARLGTYSNPDMGRQLLRFDGMDVDGKCLTDFDAVLEWEGRAWLVFEAKSGSKGVPKGQRLAIERFVRDAASAGKKACAAIVEHSVRNPLKDVYLKDCKVRSVYVSGEFRWRPTKEPMSARQLLDGFAGMVRDGA